MFGKRSLQLVDGKQKRGFAQLIGMHSIAYVPYRADGKNHFQLRVPGNQTGEKGSIVGYNLLHTKLATNKDRFRLLVAVCNNMPRSLLFVHPGCTKSQHQTIQLMNAFVCRQQAGIDALQSFLY